MGDRIQNGQSTSLSTTYDYDTDVCTAAPEPASTPLTSQTFADITDTCELEPAAAAWLNPPSTVTPGATNADRTQARLLSGPTLANPSYAEAGETSTGDSGFLSAAAIKGTDTHGVSIEMAGANVQVGAQNEASLTAMQVGVSGRHGALGGAAGVTAGAAEARIGTYNKDGSRGLNAGAVATAVGGEATINYAGNSVTAGAALSLGLGGSIGIRNADGDDTHELCARVELTVLTLGACIETPW